MKKTIRSFPVLSFVFLGLMLGIGLTSFSSAQTGDSVLVQKLDALIDQLAGARSETTQQAENNAQLQESRTTHNKPSCIDNYQAWPSSTQKAQNTPWNLDHLVFYDYRLKERYREQHFDVNGDGLLDYLYSDKNFYNQHGYNRTKEYSCLYLNNGSGWDETYRCVYIQNASEPATYYGDCAQL